MERSAADRREVRRFETDDESAAGGVMQMFMLTALTLCWVWLIRPGQQERSFRPTKFTSEDIWTALLAPGSGDLIAATTATRRAKDRTLSQLASGEDGWLGVEAVGYDYAGALWLRTSARLDPAFSPQTPLHVARTPDGFVVKGPIDEERRVDLGVWLRKGTIIPALRGA
ncbi:MAG: hypothetical protein ACR2MA_11405 [Egibacteraceae bacterium]